MRHLAAVALGLAATGCAAKLPYTPAAPSSGVRVSAGYEKRADGPRVEIDAEGYRVESAEITLTDGGVVPPLSLDRAGGGSGLRLGLGVGGGSYGGSLQGGAGLGIGTGFGGPPRARTVAIFPLDRIGAPPWRLRVKVVGAEPVDIVLLPPSASP